MKAPDEMPIKDLIAEVLMWRENDRLQNEPEQITPCDVDGCDSETVSGGMSWRDTGYWRVCSKHFARNGDIQPKMRQSSIDRENSRGKDGVLPIEQPAEKEPEHEMIITIEQRAEEIISSNPLSVHPSRLTDWQFREVTRFLAKEIDILHKLRIKSNKPL